MMPRRAQIPKLGLLLLLLLLLPRCREDLPVELPVLTTFTGITETAEDGTVLSSDPDDWRSIIEAGLYVQPAYPNPCDRSSSFTISFRLSRPESLRITLNDRIDHVARTVISETVPAGPTKFKPAVAYMDTKIYRLYITVIRPDAEYTTYGDVDIR